MRAHVIEMFVAHQNEADITWVEAEPPDIGENQRRGFGHAAVDKDMPVVAGDQHGRNAAGADVKAVAHELERRGRLVPIVPRLASVEKG